MKNCIQFKTFNPKYEFSILRRNLHQTYNHYRKMNSIYHSSNSSGQSNDEISFCERIVLSLCLGAKILTLRSTIYAQESNPINMCIDNK